MLLRAKSLDRWTILNLMILFAVLVVAGRPDTIASPSTEPSTTWGEPVLGCRLGVSGVSRTVKPGEIQHWSVVVENQGDCDIYLQKVRGERQPTIALNAVLDDKAVSPKQAADLRPTSLSVADKLDPGRRIEWDIRPSDTFDFEQPGTYSVTIELSVYRKDTKELPASTQPASVTATATFRVTEK